MSLLKRMSLPIVILGLLTSNYLSITNSSFHETLYDLISSLSSENLLKNSIINKLSRPYAEKIDDQLYAANTIKKIEEVNADALNKMNDPIIKDELTPKIEALFNRMEGNIDDYLDWFYSIGGDYQKAFYSLTGSLETKMKIKLQQELYKNTDHEVKALINAINLQLLNRDHLESERITKIKEILNENIISNDPSKVQILKTVSLKNSFNEPNYFLNITDLTSKLNTGNLSNEIGSTIAKKMLGKGPFKSAIRTISKWFAKNTSSLAESTLIGAGTGTAILPGVGTLAGGAISAVTDLCINKATLKYEEFTDRQDLKKILINNINESKEEFINKLFDTNPFKSKENNELLSKAEQGNVEAQIKIGTKYETGDDIEQNVAEALKWYQKAADQGSSNAKVNIANLYRIGSGVKQSDVDALFWYQQAADQGNSNAQNELGVMYFNGTGIDKNNANAASWFKKSADQGNSDAQVNLGVMYQKGDGIEKNEEEAVSLIQKSAEQGNNQAQLHLAEMYQNGYGVEKNTKEACAFFKKSADQGNTDAQIGLASCYQSGDGIEKNDELADFWYKEAAVIKSKDNVRLINTISYLTNLNKFVTSVGTDEYVIVKSTKVENFTRESGKHINTPFGPISTSHSTIKANVEANYSYHVNLTTLKYSMENEILVFNVPKLFLSKPVAENTAAYNYKCRTTILKQDVPYDDLSPDCTKAGNLLHTELSNELEATGETNKANVYTNAATSLAHNFDSFAKNNDKGIYYRKISVIFDDEIGKPRREFEINKSYCGDEPCKLEVPVGNGQILTIK